MIEIAASSLEDDRTRKQALYQQAGVREYWVVNVNAGQVMAVDLSQTAVLGRSQVLPDLAIDQIEVALTRAQTEDDGAVSRWFLSLLAES